MYSIRKKEEGRRKKEEGGRKKEKAIKSRVCAIKNVLISASTAITDELSVILPNTPHLPNFPNSQSPIPSPQSLIPQI
jgi:hypothetical protein